MARKGIDRLPSIGIHINTRETLAEELVCGDISGGIDGGTGTMNRSGPLRVPSGPLLAHVLYAHCFADRPCHDGSIRRRIIGVVAAVGARPHRPDCPDLVDRDAEHVGDAVANEMRFLRAGPASHLAVLDFDNGAGGTHGRVRLKRPLVLGFNDASCAPERVLDVADLLGLFALADRRLADVIIERGSVREWRRRVGPLYLQLFRRLNGIPFSVRDNAEEAFVPDNLSARDVLDRTFIDLDRQGTGDRRPDHTAMHHARHFDIGDEILLAEHLRRYILTPNRPPDDLVFAWFLWLRLAGSVQGVADFLVPVELNVEILPPNQLCVARLLGIITLGVNNAVRNGQLVNRQHEFLCCHFDQHPARLGCCSAHLFSAELYAG